MPASALAARSLGDLPVIFEANVGQGAADAQFVGRGNGADYALTHEGIRIVSAGAVANGGDAKARDLTLRFVDAHTSLAVDPQSSGGSRKHRSRSRSRSRSGRKSRSRRGSSHPSGERQSRPHEPSKPSASQRDATDGREFAALNWQGSAALAAETNYFLGHDPAKWHTHVPNFSEVAARGVVPGIDVTFYGTRGGAEYDVRVAPGADPASLRVALDSGGAHWQRTADGDLFSSIGATTLRMHKPVAYDLLEPRANGHRDSSQERRSVQAEFALAPDGTVGFAVRGHNPRATLVIDPSLTISYFTFLGGSGADTAASVAIDSSGFVYVGGTTTSLQGWGVTSQSRGNPSAGSSVFFVAKLNPAKSGAASLVYLAFIGGSGAQQGGKIAVDPAGDVVLAGTTTMTIL